MVHIGKVAFLMLKENHKMWTVQEKIFYESAANSFSYFSTHPSALHSLKISIALLRFFWAFDLLPFRLKSSAAKA